jgi:hypothetical protein
MFAFEGFDISSGNFATSVLTSGGIYSGTMLLLGLSFCSWKIIGTYCIGFPFDDELLLFIGPFVELILKLASYNYFSFYPLRRANFLLSNSLLSSSILSFLSYSICSCIALTSSSLSFLFSSAFSFCFVYSSFFIMKSKLPLISPIFSNFSAVTSSMIFSMQICFSLAS